jgi:hypothetical protein
MPDPTSTTSVNGGAIGTANVNSRLATLIKVSKTGAPAPNTLTVAPSALSFAAGGEQKSFAITSNTAWTVTSSESWCTVNTANGSNNATINVTAAANSGAQRTATITVSGTGVSNQTIAVTQAGASSGGGTLAEWDFSTLFSATANGTASMLSSTGNATLTTTASSATPPTFNAVTATNSLYNYVVTSGWNVEEAWIMEIPVTSAANGNVKVSFTPQGSNTGPRDFVVEWSSNGASWSTGTAAESYTVENATGKDKAITLATSGLSDKLYIRLRNTSTVSINGGTTAAGGTSRLTGKVTIEKVN